MTQQNSVNESSFYRKSVLPNGLRIVTEKIPYVRSVSLGVWVEAGTRDESPRENGLAHFLEHMVFKGTENRNAFEIADALESLGGNLNAFTSKELTSYYAHVLDEHVGIAMDVLSDLILHPLFDPTEIEKEKNVVIEEIRDMEDTPDDLIFEYFFRDLFSPHPLSFSTLGQQEIVRNFTQADLRRFLKTRYTANRIVIAAAGNVEHSEIEDLAATYFSNLPRGEERNLGVLPESKSSTHFWESKAQQSHICLGCRTVPYNDSKRHSLLVLHTILGAGMSSRLFQRLREEYALAYSVFSFTDFYLDTGVFGVYIGTDETKIDQTIDLILKEFKKLPHDKIRELEKKKSELKGNLLLGLESTSNRMSRLAKMEIYLNQFRTLDDVIRSIEDVTVEDITATAKEFLHPERLVETIMKPKSLNLNAEGIEK